MSSHIENSFYYYWVIYNFFFRNGCSVWCKPANLTIQSMFKHPFTRLILASIYGPLTLAQVRQGSKPFTYLSIKQPNHAWRNTADSLHPVDQYRVLCLIFSSQSYWPLRNTHALFYDLMEVTCSEVSRSGSVSNPSLLPVTGFEQVIQLPHEIL